MRLRYLFILAVMAVMVSGCAEIEPPNPGRLLTKPLGEIPVRVGMTKDEIISQWGEPDLKDTSSDREEWVYRGRYSGLPIDRGYLSKTKHLYFDGDYLVGFDDK